MLKDIKNFLHGCVFGMTLIVPGVSATVLAIMLGFYEELMGTINGFNKNRGKNTRYMAVFLLGVAAGAVAFSAVIMLLLNLFSLPLMLFFVGLLVGTVPQIAVKARGSSPKIAPREIVLAAIAVLALAAISFGMQTESIDPAAAVSKMSLPLVLYIVLAGALNGATLVIPGLSGALFLLVMGLYQLIVFSISSIAPYLADPGNLFLLRDIAVVLLPYGLGALFGCLAMAKLMQKLMQHHKKSVYAVITGFIIGSVITMVNDPYVYEGGTSPGMIAAGILTLCCGFFVAYFLGKRHNG